MRVGIIGCGGISGVHARSIGNVEGSCLAAVADIVPERAGKLAAQYGAQVYTDWEAMLEKERLDIVHICTPHSLHTPMAVRCLEKGMHVFTEKPPIISWEQLRQLTEASDKGKADGKRRLGVCFQNRWNPEVQYAKELLKSGALGPVEGVRGFVTWCRDKSYYENGWHGKMALEGGGALINQGIHTLDMIQFLIDERADVVEAIQGNLHLQREMEVEDTLCAYIHYPGVRASLYVTNGYADDESPLVEVQCAKGRIRLEDGGITIWKEGKAVVHPFEQGEVYGKAYWGAGHQKAISHFYQSVEEGTEDLLDFGNVKDTLELLLRIYDSARSGEANCR